MDIPTQLNKASKFLSYVLRHKPETIDLTLNEQGWADIDELILKANHSAEAPKLSHDLITAVVNHCAKQRFALDTNNNRIRANQGHSIDVDLQLKPAQPPEVLYHGTASHFVDSIFQQGLTAQQRQYVHLTDNLTTAKQVGQRYGRVVILQIDTQTMIKQGKVFYRADNGVWLTEAVAVEFLTVHNA